MASKKNRKHAAQAKSGDTGRSRSLAPALKFVLSFVGSLAVLGTVYAWITARYHDSFGAFMEFTATISGGVASLFADITRSGRYLTCGGFSVEIIDECTGVLEMVIFLAAVVAFPTTWRKKLIGAALGVPLIYLFNVIRIIVLLFAGAYSNALFDFLHLYFWQGTLIIIIAAAWIGWLYFVVFRETKRTVAVSG